MPFDFNNFLTLAEELATKADEASKRSSISRAYYSVYHLAFARAERTAGRHPRNVPYHQWCWQKYSSTPDPACQQLGTDGDRLKRRRHKADYDRADYARLDDEVTRALEEARQFRIDLAAIDPAHPLP